MYPYRVFVAYAHEDEKLADRLHDRLTAMGLINMWDKTLPPAARFDEEILRRISCSHLFVPLITRRSLRRPWVHQETGYALGVNVPVLPIAVGRFLPAAIIRDLHAVRVRADLSGLEEQINERVIRGILQKPHDLPLPSLVCAEHPQSRTALIVKYLRESRSIAPEETDRHIRERAAFSTFSIPDADPDDQAWAKREGEIPLDKFHRELLWQQRTEAEQEVRKHGCSLIITPSVRPRGMSNQAICAHLELLLAFLRSIEDSKCTVAVATKWRSNLLIRGDWFLAESHRPLAGVGFKQTLLTWHAPYVLRRRTEFDGQLKRLLKERGWQESEARVRAIELLEQMVEDLRAR